MFEQIIKEDILKLEESKPKDYWEEKAEAPLFTKDVFYKYNNDTEKIDEGTLTLKIDTRDAQARNPFNALICASTGTGKTRLIKNIVKAFCKAGYKILYFEPKGIEMLNAKYMGKGVKIHPLDKNEKLSVSSYVPNYIKFYIEQNFPDRVNDFKYYSPDIRTMDYPEIWQSLGIPVKIASFIIEAIKKGHSNFEYLEKSSTGMTAKSHFMTRQAVETTMASLKASQFFGTTKKLDLEKEWEKNNVVVINYFSRDGAFMNTDVGLVLDLVRDISIREMSGGMRNISKKLIIFDDAFYYAGMSASMATKSTGGTNLAIRNIANCQNNYRSWGIDTMFVVQSPDSNAIYPSLIDGCTTKFVSYVENPMSLQGKLPADAYALISNTNPMKGATLYVDEERYIFQWIYVKGRTRWYTGFPFDCTLGHT